jgi:hypothetical protein
VIVEGEREGGSVVELVPPGPVRTKGARPGKGLSWIGVADGVKGGCSRPSRGLDTVGVGAPIEEEMGRAKGECDAFPDCSPGVSGLRSVGSPPLAVVDKLAVGV